MHTLRKPFAPWSYRAQPYIAWLSTIPTSRSTILGTLHRLSQMTGGEVLVPAQLSEIGALCLRIAKTFAPAIRSPTRHPIRIDTPFPQIRVVASAPASGKLKVRARTSYILEK
jgi:hypothetical protein